MSRIAYTLWIAVVAILLLLTAPYLLRMLGVIFVPSGISIWRQLTVFQWVGAGIGIYTVIYNILPRQSALRNNLLWFETFTHELTHTVEAITLLREVPYFHE